MSTNKKVLIIAYLFPPIGGGGVQRALKMAKYLGQFNWDVHVLTVEPTHHVSLDESLLNELPNTVTIHRCMEFAPWKTAVLKSAPVPTPAPNASSSQENKPASPSFIATIKKSIRSLLKKIKNTLLIPDDQILWYPYAKRQGLHIMEQHDIDVIFSTSGPHTNHLVARYLKRKTAKTWIADFRDPWTQNMHHTKATVRSWIEDKLERSVIRESDCLLTVTHAFATNFKKKYTQEIQKIEVIHNGYDQEDYKFLEEQTHISASPEHHTSDKFTLIYTGIFYKERNPRLLLRAVQELIQENKIPKERIHLQFAGVFDYPGNNENQNSVKELQLENAVEIMGHLPHKQALQAMKAANVLLLVGDTHPDSGNYIPGKLYEYMAIGHPILALSLPGESTNIIEQYKLGEIVDPSSVEQIKAALLKLYHQWEVVQTDPTNATNTDATHNHDTNDKPIASPPSAAVLIYERKEQARMLAELMDELVLKKEFDI